MQKEIKYIAHHYGIESQLKKLAEECCELGQAALKNEREPGKTVHEQSLAGEIADVEIMIAQIKELKPSVAHLSELIKEDKVNRQLNRIENEKCEQNRQDIQKEGVKRPWIISALMKLKRKL